MNQERVLLLLRLLCFCTHGHTIRAQRRLVIGPKTPKETKSVRSFKRATKKTRIGKGFSIGASSFFSGSGAFLSGFFLGVSTIWLLFPYYICGSCCNNLMFCRRSHHLNCNMLLPCKEYSFSKICFK